MPQSILPVDLNGFELRREENNYDGYKWQSSTRTTSDSASATAHEMKFEEKKNNLKLIRWKMCQSVTVQKILLSTRSDTTKRFHSNLRTLVCSQPISAIKSVFTAFGLVRTIALCLRREIIKRQIDMKYTVENRQSKGAA